MNRSVARFCATAFTPTLACVSLLAVTSSAQDGAPTVPAFDVVSVRPNRSGAEGQSGRVLPSGRLTMTNASLRTLIQNAYGVLPDQIVGGPRWLDADRFDIVAQTSQTLPPTAPGGPPSLTQLMVQRLLAERFGLVVRAETRERPIYALTLSRDDGRLRPRMTRASVDCDARMAAYGRGAAPMPARTECGISRGVGRVSARGINMPMFAQAVLAGPAGRVVQDRTGLTGGFDLDLEFSPESATLGPAAAGDTASLFTALIEQLGLRLRAERAPVPVIVIDRADQPTEN
jgi:uncharacterized protein (TIGR03435 family)